MLGGHRNGSTATLGRLAFRLTVVGCLRLAVARTRAGARSGPSQLLVCGGRAVGGVYDGREADQFES